MNSLLDFFLLQTLKKGDFAGLLQLPPGETKVFTVPAFRVSITRHKTYLEVTATHAGSEVPEFFKVPLDRVKAK